MNGLVLFGVEGLMKKNDLTICQMDFMKVIHVELTHEGGVAIVSEITRKDGLL